jgi:FkbM family methyltransferase
MHETVSIGGLKIVYGHPHDLAGMIEVFVLNIYDVDRIPEGALVIDLGAGVGDFAVAAGHRVRKRGLVIAVEPNPTDFGLLRENVEANRLDNVVALRAVIGDPEQDVFLSFKGETFSARAITLSNLLRDAGLTFADCRNRPIVLKVDVEGAEVEVLRNLLPLLEQVRFIAIELHGTKSEVDAVLIPQGFKFLRTSNLKCLLRTLMFSVRHPLEAIDIWRRFRASSDYPGVRKILSGIEIANSPGLMVGVYQPTRLDDKSR